MNRSEEILGYNKFKIIYEKQQRLGPRSAKRRSTMYFDREDFKYAKDQALTTEISMGAKRTKKTKPKPKADHKHEYEDFIEAEGESPDSRVAKVHRCLICGRESRDELIFAKDDVSHFSTMIFTVAGCQRCNLPYRVRKSDELNQE